MNALHKAIEHYMRYGPQGRGIYVPWVRYKNNRMVYKEVHFNWEFIESRIK